MENCVLISDAAKEVQVESHVLRYWEEELRLPIKRNELGHRYYTEADVERFKQIKDMKERGLQLKAIKMILKNGRLDMLGERENGFGKSEACVKEKDAQLKAELSMQKEPQTKLECMEEQGDESIMAIHIVEKNTAETALMNETESREEKSMKLQWMLREMIKSAVQENNEELCREIKESVMKELDYQFRMQEEREESREKRYVERNEEYYKRMDELLRKKTKRHLLGY